MGTEGFRITGLVLFFWGSALLVAVVGFLRLRRSVDLQASVIPQRGINDVIFDFTVDKSTRMPGAKHPTLYNASDDVVTNIQVGPIQAKRLYAEFERINLIRPKETKEVPPTIYQWKDGPPAILYDSFHSLIKDQDMGLDKYESITSVHLSYEIQGKRRAARSIVIWHKSHDTARTEQLP